MTCITRSDYSSLSGIVICLFLLICLLSVRVHWPKPIPEWEVMTQDTTLQIGGDSAEIVNQFKQSGATWVSITKINQP